MGLSQNSYTTTEKDKLAGITSGAQVNVIESISKNGTALTISNKNVDITVPTKTSDLTNDGNGATPSDPVVTGIQGNVNYTVLYKERGALDSTYEENKPTAVGQYTVKVVTDVTQNYLSASATYDFEITAPAITKYPKPTASTTSFTYDGTLKTLAVTGYNEAGMLMSGDISATNAGDYTVVYTLNPYTAWDDDSTDAVIINWTIEKANNTVTVTMEDWVYGNAAPSPSVTGIKGNAQYTVYYKVRNANDSTYTATVPSEIGEYTIKAVTAE